MKKYEMSIDLNVLNHLGINLYSNTPAVLSEVIANSWDADATKVQIDIDQEADSITITDNGNGMSLAEINDKYLKVGYSKREQGETKSPKLNRPVMGRKGIGKLSLFSIADNIQIHTTDGQSKNAFEMSRESIQQSISQGNSLYNPTEIPFASFKFKRGTKIVISGFKKRIERTEDFLRTRLARRFSILSDDFKIILNGKPITLEDRQYFNKLQFIWPIGNFDVKKIPIRDSRIIQDSLSGDISGTNYKINGWIGCVYKPSDIKENNKLSITARGKMSQEDILSSYGEGGIYATYLIGEISAEFLDDDEKDDITTSNRQQYIEDEERYISLKDYIFKLLKTIQSKWTDLRTSRSTEEILKSNPAIKAWYDSLYENHKKYARKLFSTIETMHFDGDEKKKNEFLKYGILAFERLKITQKINAFDQENILENIVQFGEVFNDLQDLEATLYWDIAHERVNVIRALADRCDENVKENILQKYIYDNLWLLNPSWERAAIGTERIEERVTKEFKKIENTLTEKEKSGRLDIRYRNTSGTHIIIELKRYTPNYKVDVYDLHRQINKYRTALKKCLEFSGRGNEPIDAICIIGEGVLEDNMTLKEANKILGNDGRILFYDQIITDALESYSEYLDREKRVGKIRSLIDQIE